MHIDFGSSPVSLPLAPPGLPMADASNNMMPDDAQQQKRPRSHFSSSPSPASVMNGDLMIMETQQQYDFASPATKRRRYSEPEVSTAQPTAAAVGASAITPEEHRPPVAMEFMEREDQYDEWWKKPPAAPQLLESTTVMHSNDNTDKSNVLGCNSCQRLFVPPKITPPNNHDSQHQATLLQYFSSNKPATKPPAPTATPQVDFKSCRCTFCERSTCNNCLRECEQCQHNFCILCSTRAYLPNNPRQEQTLCLDCASMLDIPSGEDAMMEG